MENATPSSSPPPMNTNTDTSVFSNKVIIALLALLIFAFLGINLLVISGNAIKQLTDMFGPIVINVAKMLGYSTGHLVNTTADVTADTAKLGIDIAEGTAQSIGNLLKDASKGGMDESDKQNLEKALTPSNCPKPPSPEPDKSSNVIQSAISSKKNGWCFVGEDNGTRGCVSVDEHDKCMSGQIFPSKETCLAPTA
jgi:hypothetical protein